MKNVLKIRMGGNSSGNKSTPKGAVTATLLDGKKPLISVCRSIGKSRDFEQAYKEVKEWVYQQAKKHNIKESFVTIKSKGEVLEIINQKPFTRVNGETVSTTKINEVFGDLAKFKATIRVMYKESGYDYVKNMLDEASATLEDSHKDERKRLDAISDANHQIANVLFDVWLKTGVDTSGQTCENVQNLFKLKVKEHKNDLEIKKAKGKSTNVYVLDGQRWDGVGTPPAEFLKWRRQENAQDFEALRVG